MDAAGQLLRVVRGEADWRTLKECGFSIEREAIEGGFRWTFNGAMPASVVLTRDDIAAAVLRLRDDIEALREWSRFIMVVDCVDWTALDDWPRHDEVVDAMWDFGTWANPESRTTLIRIAEAIQSGDA